MKRWVVFKKVLKCDILFLFFLLLLFPLVSISIEILANHEESSDLWSSPQMDNFYFRIVYPEYQAVEKAKAGELDVLVGMINPDNVQELEGLGWNISIQQGFHMCYLGINCRNATPSSSGKYVNYHNRTPGFELYPLNISAFRYALHLLVGDKKEAWIRDIYGIIFGRLDTVIPPANKFWFDSSVPAIPYDPKDAYRILNEAGFNNASGFWTSPNGQEMRQIYVMATGSPPTISLVGRIVDSWNSFFGKMSDGKSQYFIRELYETGTATDIAFYNRDHDVYILCWGLKRNPDYLYDFFHPNTDIEGGNNSPGLDSPLLNDLLWKLEFCRDPATGALLNQTELKTICKEAQWVLYYQTPYIPIFSTNYINAYRPGLAGWAESPGYGSAPYEIMMPWTYLNVHWKNQPLGGNVNWHLPGSLSTLNPGTAKWGYEKTVLNRIYDPLITVNPCTHEDLPWAATKWQMDPYLNESEGVYDGMKITFWLRGDIYWHDGDPVTADDVIWNFDFIKSIGNAGGFKELSSVWQDYIKSEKISSYCFAIYVNSTSFWKIYDYACNALKFPRQVWEPYWGNAEAADAFKPWENLHPNVPSLTCLIGTGPYIFVKWDKTLNYVQLHINRAEYPKAGFAGYWAAWHYWAKEPIPADVNEDFKVDLRDLRRVAMAEGSHPSEWNWFPRADINKNGIIDSEDFETVWKYIVRNYKQLTTKHKKMLEAILEYKIQIQ